MSNCPSASNPAWRRCRSIPRCWYFPSMARRSRCRRLSSILRYVHCPASRQVRLGGRPSLLRAVNSSPAWPRVIDIIRVSLRGPWPRCKQTRPARWYTDPPTSITPLRKNKASMSCMVFRRELLDELAIDVEETGPLADWAIARQLVTDKEALILPLRNVELAPKIAIGNHIMEVVTQRIVSWYLDTGRGGLPIPAAWSRLSAAQGVERLHYLDARLRNNELYVHEGNAELLAEFAARFGKRPLFHSVVNHLLLHHPGVALPRFGKRSAWAAAMYGPWRFCLRGYFKYRRLGAKDDGRVAA